MYPPPTSAQGYPEQAQKGYPPPSVGIPVTGSDQYYPSGVPSALHVQQQAPGRWSTGLCGCCDDVGNCCMTFFCPCVTFGRIAEIVDRGSTSCGASGALYTLIACVTGCGCLYSCFYRSKMRRQYSLPDSPCNDCLVHCCCEACALCQEYRELKNRGYDMALGWQGHVEKQAGGPTAPPATQSGMSR
uniref:Protein PLANT CADMIUM RESISTANCE 2 n=1 Tax=Anthurium amnicola TaxID=1678845 RepID=A0A1D1Y102_9ARAE